MKTNRATSKICSKCERRRARSKFRERDNGSLEPACKDCNNKTSRATYQRRRAEKIAKVQAWQAANPERTLENGQRWRGENERYIRIKRLNKKYNISLDDYRKKLIAQDFACAGCLTKDRRVPGLCVDHDHSCCPGPFACGNCNRGLLCKSCNFTLAWAGDSAETLRNLAAYLERHRGQGKFPGSREFLIRETEEEGE